MTDDRPPLTRRRYLTGTTLLGALALSGCSGLTGSTTETDDDPDVVTDPPNETATPTATPSPTATESERGRREGTEPLEILHYWSAGDGEDAMNALLDGFRDAHPEVRVEALSAVPGGGQGDHAAMRRRIQDGDPPGTWQVWPGANLRPFLADDLLGSIRESVWKEGDMLSTYPDGVRALASPDETYVAVPVDVHRVNNLFYNVHVVESAGVDPSTIDGPRALVDAMERVRTQTDATPLAHQTRAPWSTLQLFETVLLGQAGVDTYEAFAAGNLDRAEPAVRDALETLVSYREYFPDDAATISWTQGNQRVVEGEAAFIHQGDWVAGAYREATDFAFETDWDAVPFPGTGGQYLLQTDAFAYPADNPSPRATAAFLRYAGSAEGQALFNAEKGAVPPRTDASTERFGPFQTRQHRDYRRASAYPPSITHGLAVPPERLSALRQAMDSFVTDWDVEAALEASRKAV